MHTATPKISTLSLHDALPIWGPHNTRSSGFGLNLLPFELSKWVMNCSFEPLGRSTGSASSYPICHSKSKRPLSTVLRSEEHTSELQSQFHLVCRLLLEKKKII